MQFTVAYTITLRPNVDGYVSQWAPVGCDASNHWMCVDESVSNTTDYLRASLNRVNQTFNFTDLPPRGNYTIYNVDFHYYAKQYNSTKYAIQTLLNNGMGSEYFGKIFNLTSNYTNVQDNLYTNPFTGVAWTEMDVNNLQGGMRTALNYGGGYVAQVYVVVNYTLS